MKHWVVASFEFRNFFESRLILAPRGILRVCKSALQSITPFSVFMWFSFQLSVICAMVTNRTGAAGEVHFLRPYPALRESGYIILATLLLVKGWI